MKIKYTIKRDDLKKRKYNAGTRSTVGERPAQYDDRSIPIILKIITK